MNNLYTKRASFGLIRAIHPGWSLKLPLRQNKYWNINYIIHKVRQRWQLLFMYVNWNVYLLVLKWYSSKINETVFCHRLLDLLFESLMTFSWKSKKLIILLQFDSNGGGTSSILCMNVYIYGEINNLSTHMYLRKTQEYQDIINTSCHEDEKQTLLHFYFIIQSLILFLWRDIQFFYSGKDTK